MDTSLSKNFGDLTQSFICCYFEERHIQNFSFVSKLVEFDPFEIM
jgi:hypothetical protein